MNSPTKTAILLINLGTPDSLAVADVKQYLKEFLNDPYVIDLPKPLRQFLVNGIILNTRPAKTQLLYKNIWTPQGSPLLVLSQKLKEQVQAEAPEYTVDLAMRYGSPSIAARLAGLKKQNVENLIIVPLYPQYALSSTETARQKVLEELNNLEWDVRCQCVRPFFEHNSFIVPLADSLRDHVQNSDALLLSFHGLPKRKISLIYQKQCYATAQAVAKELNWPWQKTFVAFQSRLSWRWIQPFTDKMLNVLPAKGIARLTVACPSFTTDCLETLEEMDIRGRKIFIAAGGKQFTYVPCLNDRRDWSNSIVKLCQTWTDPLR